MLTFNFENPGPIPIYGLIDVGNFFIHNDEPYMVVRAQSGNVRYLNLKSKLIVPIDNQAEIAATNVSPESIIPKEEIIVEISAKYNFGVKAHPVILVASLFSDNQNICLLDTSSSKCAVYIVCNKACQILSLFDASLTPQRESTASGIPVNVHIRRK